MGSHPYWEPESRASTRATRIDPVISPPNGWPLSCGRAESYHDSTGRMPSDWQKPAAVSFSGLLGGGFNRLRERMKRARMSDDLVAKALKVAEEARNPELSARISGRDPDEGQAERSC